MDITYSNDGTWGSDIGTYNGIRITEYLIVVTITTEVYLHLDVFIMTLLGLNGELFF